MAEKSYRIRTNVGEDTVVKASLSQDIDFLEVLSLKINQEDTYRLHVSNYGIVVGRVLANEAFGIPNAKVSIFIRLTDEDLERSEITNLYPYKTLTTKDKENRRYNLLSDSSNDDCYRIVGTFPNKRLVLDNDTEIEIYEKYWKYTTVTNQSGDYMIFGVPTGNQTIHVDIDLSDIGILSQKPRDFFYKGYNKEQFDSSEQFQDGTNLDNLTQLLSQNSTVDVLPFFGDKDENEIAISRCDIQIPYKFEPTCVFLGSIISDRQGEHIGHACGPTYRVGQNGNMTTGEGTIEMIRKTPDGLIEEFPIKGNRLIDGDGVWCYQIPMNLDFIGTDEFGNIIPVQDSKKGIPTRTSVRFRISMQETKTATSPEHVAKYLVPNVHELYAKSNIPQILNGSSYNTCYEFGSATPKEFFRDLLWNKVYSVKNYIPRFEHVKGNENRFGRVEKNYTGIRSINSNHTNNVFPFNSARFRLKFAYRILCLLMTIVVEIISFYNKLVSEVICWKLSFKVFKWRVNLGRPLKFLSKWIKCIGLKGEMFFEEKSDTYYFPKCDKDCGSIIEEDGLKVVKNKSDLLDLIQQTLALEYDVVNLDFYNDWVNGTLYMPLWFWKKRAKKKFFFGLFSKKAINTFCSCDKTYQNIKLTQTCSSTYDSKFQPIDTFNSVGYSKHVSKKYGEDIKIHKRVSSTNVKFGVIKEFTNNAGLNVYYYAPGVPNDTNYLTNNGLTNYTQLFATDIILLGSLNNCDLDNLPKTFDSLPSSSVNLPFIATLSGDDSGDGSITGLDWGNNGQSQKIKYQNGLLMDLTCWDVFTRFKSCVNLSRLSELHVTYDMDLHSDDGSEESVVHDGLITSKELVENETRAKFASLNHNGMTNMIKNVTTNYDTYKFHYIYPVSFDGHLGQLENAYTSSTNRNSFNDSYDSNYTMYRLGEGKDSELYGRHKKHFYIGNEKKFAFPLFNNSFYFYFGLNEGKTSIDKFNTLFNASCTKQNKFDFTIEYISKPGKWCYNTANTSSDFGTIDIEFNGLSDTFSYRLINEFNEELISETNVISKDLRFGYDIVEGGGSYILTSNGYKKDGRLKEFKTGNLVKNSLDLPIYLENGVYFLEVTNSFGRKVTQKLNMIQNVVSPNIEEISLGTKYKHLVDKVSDICGEMDYYGELRIKSFIIDGEEAYVKNMTPYFKDSLKYYYDVDGNIILSQNGFIEYEGKEYVEKIKDGVPTVEINQVEYVGLVYDQPKEVTCKVLCTDGSELFLSVEPENDETQEISNFVCYGVGNIPSIELEQIGDGIYSLVFNIWKPGDYTLTCTQICDGVMNDNTSINTFSIENGEKFQAFLNDVPLQLIHNENFKNTNRYSGDTFPRAWLQLENPKLYSFSGTKHSDMEFWENFMDLEESSVISEDGDNIIKSISAESKLEILGRQLSTIATMRNIGYIMHESNLPQLVMTTIGGKEPILIRSVHPNYAEINEENEKVETIVVENNNVLEAPLNYPHIVGRHYQKNYYDTSDYSLRLNDIIYGANTKNLGNYFAAFTNNGGMIDMLKGVSFDSGLFVESSPENALPLTTIPTQVTTKLSNYPPSVINKENGYFRSMFVDKRINIGGVLWTPIYCNYDIYGNGDEKWKSGKWQITLYNVAPMPYDEEYNIIGENLAYDIMVEDETVYTVVRVNTEGTNDDDSHFRFKKIENNYYEIDNNFGIFKGYLNAANGSSVCVISGSSREDLEYKMQYYFFDDKIFNLKFDESMSSFTFNKLRKASVDDFKSDKNVKLVTHLDWYTDEHPFAFHSKRFMYADSKLYKCILDIDGVETDLRDEFDFLVRGSENYKDNLKFEDSSCNVGKTLLLPTQGSQLTLETANCKMTGDLEQEIEKDENGKEFYVFKSHVESGGDVKSSFNIGPRVNVLTFDVSYESKNGGEYIIWNNERIFLESKNEYVSFPCENSKDNEYTVKITSAVTNGGNTSYITKEYVLERVGNNGLEYKNKDGNEISGYVVSTHMSLNQEMYDNLVNMCSTQYKGNDIKKNKFKFGTNYTIETYYYKGNLIQEYLNSYGVPIYMNKFGNNDNNMMFGYDLDNLKKHTAIGQKGEISAFGSYFYTDDKGKYHLKKDYIVFKINIDKNNTKKGNIYVFYTDRTGDQNFDYEKDAMFYVKTKSKSDKISLPSKIIISAITENGEVTYKYYENLIDEIGHNSQSVSRFYLSKLEFTFIDRNGNKINIDAKSMDYVYDGNTAYSGDSGVYVYEYNDINNRWYVRDINETDNNKAYYKLSYSGNIKYRNSDDKNGIDVSEDDGDRFISLSRNSVVISFKREIKDLKENELTLLNRTPKIQSDNGEEYVWLKREYVYEYNEDKSTIFITGVGTFAVYNSPYSTFNSKRINDFSCKVLRDEYTEEYDSIEANAPFLSCSVIKKYGFHKTTVKCGATNGSAINAEEWVSSNGAIVNKHPKNIRNGEFLYSQPGAVVNNKYYNIDRYAPKHDKDYNILNKNGEKIKLKLYDGSNEEDLKVWDYIALIEFKNGKREIEYGGISGKDKVKLNNGLKNNEVEDAINDIELVKISHDEYVKLFNITDVKIAPHRSISDSGEFECWDIKLQKYGENFYYQGQTHIENALKDNIESTNSLYTNCNISRVLPHVRYGSKLNDYWRSTEDETYSDVDNGIVEKYFNRSKVIGEVFPYFDLLSCGTIDGDGLFEFTDIYAEQQSFAGVGKIGMQYGHYEPFRVNHQTKKDGLDFYGYDGKSKDDVDAYESYYEYRNGVGFYGSNFYADSGAKYEYEKINENSDMYDNIIYVLQSNVDTNIIEGTEIITCSLLRTYYDSNLDYKSKRTVLFNQSSSFHVGKIYVGNIIKEDSKLIIPFYMINGMNEEIYGAFNQKNLKFYFNGYEGLYDDSKDEEYSAKTVSLTAKFYPNENERGNYSLCLDTHKLYEKIYTNGKSIAVEEEDNEYFMPIGGVINLSTNNKTKLKLTRVKDKNSGEKKRYLKFNTQVLTKPTNLLSLGNGNYELDTTNSTSGDTIIIDVDTPINDFKEYLFSNFIQVKSASDVNGIDMTFDTETGETGTTEKPYLPGGTGNTGGTGNIDNTYLLHICNVTEGIYCEFPDNIWKMEYEWGITQYGVEGIDMTINPDLGVENGETGTTGGGQVIWTGDTGGVVNTGDTGNTGGTGNTDQEYLNPNSINLSLTENNANILSSAYSGNVSCAEFFAKAMQLYGETNIIDENTNTVDYTAFSSATESLFSGYRNDKSNWLYNSFLITFNKQIRSYDKDGKIYYNQIIKEKDENGNETEKTKSIVRIDGADYDELYDIEKSSYYIKIPLALGGQAYRTIDCSPHRVMVTNIEIIEEDPDNFELTLSYPNNENNVIKLEYNGMIENHNYRHLVYNKDEKTYRLADRQDEHIGKNDGVLDIILESISELEIGESIIMTDGRVHDFYPSSYSGISGENLYFSTLVFNGNEEIKYDGCVEKDVRKIYYNQRNPFNDVIDTGNLNYYDPSEYVPSKDDLMFIQCAKCTLEKDYLTQIICEDGYSTVNINSESLTTINSNGEMETFTYGEIKERGMLGLSLYHLSEVDGVYYEFVSKISKVQEIAAPKILCVENVSDLTKGKHVLTLNVNNLNYKLPFTYDGNGNFTPNF